MIMKLRFRHLEVIHEVIKTGSVTGAARNLHVSQPAISNVLKDAEDILGLDLFVRAAGKLAPTKEAVIISEEISKSFIGLEKINNFCSQLIKSRHKIITVASTPAFAATVLPKAILAYKEKFPETIFNITTRRTLTIQSMVSSQKADIGFALELEAIPGIDKTLINNPPIYCVVQRGHELAKKAKVNIKDLVPYDKIYFHHLYEGTTDNRSILFDESDAKPRIVASTASALTACALVNEGLGFALVHATAILPFLKGNIVAIPVEPKVNIGHIFAYTLQSTRQDEKISYLIQAAIDAARMVEKVITEKIHPEA